MKSTVYQVYWHPALGVRAVKQGFSWPACCFTWIWALSKRMWGLAAWLLAFLVLGVPALDLLWFWLVSLGASFGTAFAHLPYLVTSLREGLPPNLVLSQPPFLFVSPLKVVVALGLGFKANRWWRAHLLRGDAAGPFKLLGVAWAVSPREAIAKAAAGTLDPAEPEGDGDGDPPEDRGQLPASLDHGYGRADLGVDP